MNLFIDIETVVKKDLSQQMIEEFNIKHPDEDIYER
jgi:hypothetical protein